MDKDIIYLNYIVWHTSELQEQLIPFPGARRLQFGRAMLFAASRESYLATRTQHLSLSHSVVSLYRLFGHFNVQSMRTLSIYCIHLQKSVFIHISYTVSSSKIIYFLTFCFEELYSIFLSFENRNIIASCFHIPSLLTFLFYAIAIQECDTP